MYRGVRHVQVRIGVVLGSIQGNIVFVVVVVLLLGSCMRLWILQKTRLRHFMCVDCA